MPLFQKFQGEESVSRNTRHLPHWNAEGSTYFITFRLADSIPPKAAKAMDGRRREWLSTQGITNGDASLLTTTKLRFEYRKRFGTEFHASLDKGFGECLLRKDSSLKIMEGVLRHFDGQRYDLGDFVIMPNHLHILLVPQPDNSL